MRIYLIVDDSNSDQKILAYLLKDLVEQPEIHFFQTGHSLINWSRDQLPLLKGKEIVLLCDQHLSPGSGLEVLSEFCQSHSELPCYSILMSGDSYLQQELQHTELPHNFLEKKGDLTEFEEALQACLSGVDSFFLSSQPTAHQ